ncbi:MAG: hypothetical protein QM759_13940 [Terricaulis sp.]
MSALVLALSLAACATGGAPNSEGGWTSAPGATPYETASRQCHDRTASSSGPGFDECMATLGWTHTQK